MPVELLVGVLVFSVIVNATLFFYLSRRENVKLHWPDGLRGALDSVKPRPQVDDFATLRRRPVVGRGAFSHALVVATARPATAGAAAPAHTTIAGTLPPDLAEFLSHPAPLAPSDELASSPLAGPGAADGLLDAAAGTEPSILARMPALPDRSSELAQDPLTGVEGPSSWGRIMEIENARLLRYRRPVTVVMAEVEGLRRLAERLGEEPVDRILPAIAGALRREARSSDWVARVARGRFAAYLAETDEIQAINYVERLRLACEPWLSSAAVPLRLAIGWSSPTASSDLEFAFRRAEERMHADRRMPGKSPLPPRVSSAACRLSATREPRSRSVAGRARRSGPTCRNGQARRSSRTRNFSRRGNGHAIYRYCDGKRAPKTTQSYISGRRIERAMNRSRVCR